MGLLDPPWADDPTKMLKPAPVEEQWAQQRPLPYMPGPPGPPVNRLMPPPPAGMPDASRYMPGPRPPPAEMPDASRYMPGPRPPPAEMPAPDPSRYMPGPRSDADDPRKAILAMFRKYGLV